MKKTDTHSTLMEHLSTLPSNERWCVDNLHYTDEGQLIAEAIKNGDAIAVSDGSFKDGFGTAAYVIETDYCRGRMTGKVITPGGLTDQSPYRSELSGILSILVLIKHLCEVHNISDGSIEVGCDGLSALNRAFSYVSIINADEPSYDLLAAIQHYWKFSPISWKIRHVKGHQDDHKSIDQLDRWSRLNVEMDQLAKGYISTAKNAPRHFAVHSEPWSLWVHDKKISSELSNTIYEIVHVKSVRDYWISKGRITSDTFDDMAWESIKQAMQQVPRPRRTFVSKHIVGMCGVGKFMHRWKERDNPNCPRCGSFEDAEHVWLCNGCNSSEVWESSLKTLDEWMVSVQTDPDIKSIILTHLQSWRSNSVAEHDASPDMATLIKVQEVFGWRNFFEGWIPVAWVEAQQAYYSLISSFRTGKRWVTLLITKLWDIAWDLWEHRNGVLHQQDNIITEGMIHIINRQVRSLYFHAAQFSLLPADTPLIRRSLQEILSKDYTFKKTWVSHVKQALSVGKQEVWEARKNREEALSRMRQCMKTWLRSSKK
jgi:hypothetical protein